MISIARCTARLLICRSSVGNQRDPLRDAQDGALQLRRRERAVGEALGRGLDAGDGVA
jgi:hypothetical protein